MPRQVPTNEPFRVFPPVSTDEPAEGSAGSRLSTSARIRQCAGKVKHLTMAEALVIAKAMHKKKKAKFSAYECPHCTLFHVGTDRSRQQARRRDERRRAQ